MARRGTGRWVARAAATGGGRTYRGQAPVRWYSSLVLICLLGVALVTYSRYERANPSTVHPSTKDHWYAALAFDICGTSEPVLPVSIPSKVTTGITTQGDGIIHVSPITGADTGSNATLARFVQGYTGLELTTDSLRYPGKATHKNGQTCPSGTPDAFHPGSVRIRVWPSFSGAGANHPTTYSNPASVLLANGQLITVAFVPQGTNIPKPSGGTIVTLLNLVSGQATTTTTRVTTIPPSSSTSSSSPTSSTSTSSPGSTSTTKP